MLKSFACSETDKLWQGYRSRRLPPDVQQRALVKLQLLDAAVELSFLRLPPGNRLEPLKGSRAGQHSIRVNDQRRICFVWTGTDVEQVEIAVLYVCYSWIRFGCRKTPTTTAEVPW